MQKPMKSGVFVIARICWLAKMRNIGKNISWQIQDDSELYHAAFALRIYQDIRKIKKGDKDGINH